MTKITSLTHEMRQNLAQEFNHTVIKKNPDQAIKVLADFHNALVIEQQESTRQFIEMLTSPVVVNLVERNTGKKMTQMPEILAFDDTNKGGKTLQNITKILNTYNGLLRPHGAREFYTDLTWRKDHMNMQQETAEIIQDGNCAVIGHLMMGTDDAYAEAYKIQALQITCAEDQDDEELRMQIIRNTTVVADACVKNPTPKNYETALKIFEEQSTLLPAGSEEQEAATLRALDLKKNPVKNIMDTLAQFAITNDDTTNNASKNTYGSSYGKLSMACTH